MFGPTRTPEDLMADIRRYLSLSVADSTKRTYSTGEKSFIQFLSLYRPLHVQSLPTDEDTLIQYVAYLAKSVKHSTIKGYLAAVRHFHIRHGYQLNLRKFLRLHLVCRGIKRSQGSSIRTRLPITVSHLKFFYSLLAIRYTSNYDSLMIWAAMTLAFFGFMRLGELTCNSQFSSDAHLTPLDIIFHPSQSNPSQLLVKVKVSKTDPFRMGHTLLIEQTNQSICPVNAMKHYLTRRGITPGPLFIFASGRPLTKDALTAETRQLLSHLGCQASDYAGHSYRIGAATAAASAGLPPWLVKTLGRWSSDCYERYIQCPQAVLSGVALKLLQNSS